MAIPDGHRSSKFQIPNAKQTPIIQTQKMSVADPALQIETLKVAWDLVIGTWDFTGPNDGSAVCSANLRSPLMLSVMNVRGNSLVF